MVLLNRAEEVIQWSCVAKSRKILVRYSMPLNPTNFGGCSGHSE